MEGMRLEWIAVSGWFYVNGVAVYECERQMPLTSNNKSAGYNAGNNETCSVMVRLNTWKSLWYEMIMRGQEQNMSIMREKIGLIKSR
jgi:hypothetical protein